MIIGMIEVYKEVSALNSLIFEEREFLRMLIILSDCINSMRFYIAICISYANIIQICKKIITWVKYATCNIKYRISDIFSNKSTCLGQYK
ncbi:unnamed protein product [Blepharisma stoltei]|uniref:Uncharacterized protein n=1 Tax=Blepharisma stoltei TaxID=1481888 RepID=A0AAU9K3H9_9CILI|nr:unnamed protein product [Blepharisma stoltei]